MQFSISKLSVPEKGALVIMLCDKVKLQDFSADLDKKCGGTVAAAIKASKFKGKFGETIVIPSPMGLGLAYLIVAGTGDPKKIQCKEARNLGGKIFAAVAKLPVKEVAVAFECPDEETEAKMAANIAYGAMLRSYEFKKYKTKEKDEDKRVVGEFSVLVKSSKKAKELLKIKEKIAEAVFVARNVVTEPPNVLHPESYADIIAKEFKDSKVKVTVLSEKDMLKLGMGALLGVGQGSARKSRLVVMEYNGAKSKSEKPYCFVGKGVTFDTGGISLKPAAGMEDMKYDMGGSAAVFGVMKAISGREAKVNAVGVVGLVENMPGGNAQRPSDIVTSMSGQTIEVLNTDAEGRLVLADALHYAQTKYKPKWVIDLATLTGAIVIALGSEYAGIFSNNDELADKLFKAGGSSGEKVWRFPLAKEYDKFMDSPVADMQNISSGKGAGSITAAQFLQRFIIDDTPWVHIDIAGVAWTKEGLDICPKGATGFGVRLLDQLLADNFE